MHTQRTIGRGVLLSAIALLVIAATFLHASAAPSNDRPSTPPAVRDPGPSPTLGAQPPPLDGKTIVLFDGTSWDGWQDRNGQPSRWALQDDGSILVRGGDAISTVEFTDCQLHLEFRLPLMADAAGQARANSGVYLHGQYEVQVLDSFGIEPAVDTCAAIYGIAPALVNASRPPETWQTYDIVFRAPRFDEQGEIREPGAITVLHNGIVVQNSTPIARATRAALGLPLRPSGPLLLQDHGNPVRYRNIWLRPLD
jgi:hypothetical protein